LALLGHFSPEFTRQICLYAIPAEQRRALKEVEKLLVGPKSRQIEEVTEEPNSQVIDLLADGWWTRLGSNRRPPACKAAK
jgi:hypothetical protein